jgi:hypothetical protein
MCNLTDDSVSPTAIDGQSPDNYGSPTRIVEPSSSSDVKAPAIDG